MRKVLLALMIGAVAFIPVTASADTDHCPNHNGNPNKVEGADVVQTLVLPAGTVLCLKGSTGINDNVVADGIKTIKELLNNGHDVSYYIIFGFIPPTTSTTSPPETTTTTTAPPTTTTTLPVTVTTEVPNVPTSQPGAEVTASPLAPAPVSTDQLPRTGAFEVLGLLVVGLALIALGSSLRLMNKDRRGRWGFVRPGAR